jgi:6-pyruvoyltetrahydropterin/6-carboxytetrahydropterin synthase
MAYRVTKTYGHELGLSACFRQWRADSHCRFLHGYALSFKFVFEADTLDDRNWVTDFGGLKPLKQWLCDTFDHKLVIAEDDPQLDMLASLAGLDLADVLVVEAVGCERFAHMAWNRAHELLLDLRRPAMPSGTVPRVRLIEVECREHGANAASYTGD